MLFYGTLSYLYFTLMASLPSRAWLLLSHFFQTQPGTPFSTGQPLFVKPWLVRNYEEACACVLFRQKALLFNWPRGLHVGELQLCGVYYLFSSGAVGCSTFCFQWESRQECALAGNWTSLVLYRSWRATKWHEATMFMQHKPCKQTVFSERHCGLLLWWLIKRLELYGWYKSLSCVSNA